MSWKFVFNTGFKSWGTIDKAREAAKNSGYEFLTWNGWVYIVDGQQTSISLKDLI